MHTEPVAVSFRALIENCLKAGASSNSMPPEPYQFTDLVPFQPEVRTEVNLKVLQDFLRT